ncbi:ankyrin repeat-containing domain protein [Mycena sanguinolenta]|nr:ankyrin repeat-containing domain protein [Mycena sanguinolenta]
MTPSHAPPPESKARKVVDSATNALDTALSILGTLSDLTANVPYLNAVTGVVKHLIEIREAVKNNKERANVLFEKIGTITQTIAAGLLGLDDTQRSSTVDALKGDLEKYNSVLVDAVHILKEWTSQSKVQRVFKRGDFDGIANNLDKRIEGFRDAFGVARLAALSKGQHETNTMLKTLVDSDTRTKMEKWLKRVDVGVNYRNASNKKHNGTGKWLLENSLQFREWIYAPGSFLWLHGISGSGKTVLSSMIVDKIRDLGAFLAKEAVLVSLEECVYSDIELYVGDELSKMGGYIAKNTDDIRKKLLDKGGNMFRLVALQLEALQKSGGTKSKVTKALETMPTTLAGIYDHILEMTDMRDQVCRAMNWLIFALEEMTLAMIIDALAFDFNQDKLQFDEDERMEAQSLLNACSSLISVPQDWDNNSVDTDINVQSGEYGTALQAAACGGNIDIVQLLLEHNADPNIVGGEYGTALQAAAYMGNIDIVQLLLEHHADPNIVGGEYGTPLQAAAWETIDIVKLLLEHGADVNIQGGDFGTPLQAAAAQGNIDTVKLLLELGADVNVQAGDFGTPLQAAAACGSMDIVKLFLKLGADVNIQGGDFGTPLQAAAAQGNIDIVKLFLELGTDVNIQGRAFGTPLQAAAAQGNIDIVKLFLELGADVNIQGGDFGTPLRATAAAAQGNIDIVKLLLELGADVNFQGGDLGTSLQAAAAQGHIDIVKLLLEHSADVTLQGGEYGNALQAAIAVGNSNIVQLLQAHGAI